MKMEKKRNKKKEKSEGKEIISEFVSFGNKKKVFWSITIATLIISIAGIPAMMQYEEMLKRFLVIWILEIIYIAMWIKWGEKKRRKRKQ